MATISTDWRGQLRRNQRRTHIVMVLFVSMYLLLGFLIDVFYYVSMIPNPGGSHSYGIPDVIQQLLTFQLFPYFTLSGGIVAVICIWITYKFYDSIMLLGTDHKEVTSDATNLTEKQLYNVVEEMKVAAGLNFMPKVFIIEAPYMNAFASGVSEKSSMVAITRGLIEKLDRSELQAVMAHELSHIRHQDMKLTMVATILANIMLIVVDIIFYSMVFGKREKNNNGIFVLIFIVLRYILPLVTMLLTLYISRTREYMADSGCVELMRDNEPLARALLKINNDYVQHQKNYAELYQKTQHEQIRQTAYLFDPTQCNLTANAPFSQLFSTHPTLQQRLDAIGYKVTDDEKNQDSHSQ